MEEIGRAFEKKCQKGEKEPSEVKWVAEQEKKVSIVIPVYNAEKYLGKALESLLAQNELTHLHERESHSEIFIL